jgi:hypothetical protein
VEDDPGVEWDEDLFDDDEDALPVISEPGAIELLTERPTPRPGGARKTLMPKGNVRRADAREARRQAMVAAQGRDEPEQPEWRTQMELKDRGKAAAALSSRKPTYNSDSGFGLA